MNLNRKLTKEDEFVVNELSKCRKKKIKKSKIHINNMKRAQKESYKNGRKNPSSKIIYIYNDVDEVMFKTESNFNQICIENNLPIETLKNSYKSGGTRIYQNSRACDIGKLKKNGKIVYKN
mgnify:FL=1